MKIIKSLYTFYKYLIYGPITTTIQPKSDTNSLLNIQINGYGWKAVSATTEYVKSYHKLYSDPVVTKQYSGGVRDMEWVQNRLAIYENRLKESNPFSGFAVFNKNEQFMGHAVVGSPNVKGHSEIAGIGFEEFWNKGYGQQITGALLNTLMPTLQYNSRKYHLHENVDKVKFVVATAAPKNIGSNKVLLNAGFENNGFRKGDVELNDRNLYIKKTTSTLPILFHNILLTEKAISVGLECIKIGADFNNHDNYNNFLNLAYKMTHLVGLYTSTSPVTLMTVNAVPMIYDAYYNGIYPFTKDLIESSIFLTAQFFLQNTPGINLIYYPILIAYSSKLLLDEFYEVHSILYNKYEEYNQNMQMHEDGNVDRNLLKDQEVANEHQIDY